MFRSDVRPCARLDHPKGCTRRYIPKVVLGEDLSSAALGGVDALAKAGGVGVGGRTILSAHGFTVDSAYAIWITGVLAGTWDRRRRRRGYYFLFRNVAGSERFICVDVDRRRIGLVSCRESDGFIHILDKCLNRIFAAISGVTHAIV